MTVPPAPLAIRADGGSDIGLGHIVRCAALARALVTAGRRVVWLTRTPGVLPASLASAIEIVPLPATEEAAASLLPLLNRSGSTALIADWAVTDAVLCARLRHAGIWLALVGNHTGDAIGDLHIRQRFQALSIDPDICDGSEALLLGPGYAKLPRRTVRPSATRLLVSLGGSHTRVLDQVLAALNGLPAADELDIDIRRPQSNAKPPAEDGLLDAMLAADLGVLAAGTSLHEAAATGLPAIAIPIADNQVARAREFAGGGLGIALDPAARDFEQVLRTALTRLASSAAQREQFAAAGQARVDGAGASRVAARILAGLDADECARTAGHFGPGAGSSC